MSEFGRAEAGLKPLSTYDAGMLDRPAAPSPRLIWWIFRIVWEDWRPNRRVSRLSRSESAEFFGVTVWEWCNVLYPVLAWQQDRDAGFPPKRGCPPGVTVLKPPASRAQPCGGDDRP